MAGNLIIPLFAAPASGTNLAPTGAPSETGYGAGAVGKPVAYRQGLANISDWMLWIQADSVSGLVARLNVYKADLRDPSAPTVQRHVWGPAGVGTDADKGKINGGAAIGTATHCERFDGFGPVDGFQLQLLAGTFTNLLAWLVGNERRA